MSILDIFTKKEAKKSLNVNNVGWSNTGDTLFSAYGYLQGVTWKALDITAKSAAKENIYITDLQGKEKQDKFIEILKNPQEYLTYTDLIYTTVFNLKKDGIVIWLIDETTKTILTYTKNNLQIDNTNGFLSKIKLTNGNILNKDKCVIFVNYDASTNNIYSELEKASLEIENDLKQGKHNSFGLDNVVDPSGNLKLKADLGDEEFERTRIRFNSQYQGATKAKKVLVTDNDSEFVPYPSSNRDLQYIEGRAITRDNITSILGVPKFLLGFSDNVNRGNAIELVRIYVGYTVNPMLQKITSSINNYLTKNNKTYRVKIDPVIINDEEYNLRLAQFAQQSTILTTEEIRELLGFENIKNSSSTKDLTLALITKKLKTSSLQEELITQRDKAVLISEKKLIIKLSKTYNSLLNETTKSYKSNYSLTSELKLKLKKQLQQDLYDDEEELASVAIKNNDKTYGLNLAPLLLPFIGVFIASEVIKSSKLISETLTTDIQEFVTKETENGKSVSEIKELLKEKFNQEKDYRLERIARTESLRAYKDGSHRSYEKAGVEFIQWSAIVDDKTAQECLTNNGTKVKLGQAFSNGVFGEPSHPSCRCITLPVIN